MLENVVLLQATHADSCWLAGLSVFQFEPCPAGHRVWSAHAERSSSMLNSWSASVQSSQTMSVVAWLAVFRPLPAAQVDQAVHDVAVPALPT
jgi:hypothetical protein